LPHVESKEVKSGPVSLILLSGVSDSCLLRVEGESGLAQSFPGLFLCPKDHFQVLVGYDEVVSISYDRQAFPSIPHWECSAPLQVRRSGRELGDPVLQVLFQSVQRDVRQQR
jgi:hypothetical protein